MLWCSVGDSSNLARLSLKLSEAPRQIKRGPRLKKKILSEALR